MAPADSSPKKQEAASPKGDDTGKAADEDRPEREFLTDPRRAATAITEAKKRLKRPSMPGREPPG